MLAHATTNYVKTLQTINLSLSDKAHDPFRTHMTYGCVGQARENEKEINKNRQPSSEVGLFFIVSVNCLEIRHRQASRAGASSPPLWVGDQLPTSDTDDPIQVQEIS